MNRIPPEIDGCVPVDRPSPDRPPDLAAASVELATPKPLGSIEDALLDEINPRYPWA